MMALPKRLPQVQQKRFSAPLKFRGTGAASEVLPSALDQQRKVQTVSQYPKSTRKKGATRSGDAYYANKSQFFKPYSSGTACGSGETTRQKRSHSI
jgi:hypothetical protein